MSHYDAIFRHLMSDPRSRFITALTGKKGTSLPTHAGWYTGRAVDYFAEVSEKEYVHVEIQTRVDLTMKWRMANYFSLLHHRLHKWKKDDVEIHQYLVYLGSEASGMKSDHPRFGSPYEFKVHNLYQTNPGSFSQSKFYGDWIILLLFHGKKSEDWKAAFNAICNLRGEAEKMEALFFILQLSNLREMSEMIQQALTDMGLYDALRETPLTARATSMALIGNHIKLIDDFLEETDQARLSIDEREMLLHLPEENVSSVFKQITWRKQPRSVIAAESFAFHSQFLQDDDAEDDEYGI